MSVVFFVSSIGDTDLAKASIEKLLAEHPEESIYIVPITTTAEKRVEDLKNTACHIVTLNEILKNPANSSNKNISKNELQLVNDFIKNKNIRRAYIGVPSPLDEKIPLKIANKIEIPCTIAYEYMFTAPPTHVFWKYVDKIAKNPNADFAVPLEAAKQDILDNLQIGTHALIYTVGHLSIDRALQNNSAIHSTQVNTVKETLGMNANDELAFISGTTQPQETDNKFLKALLSEYASGQYSHLQIRFGIHPGVSNLDEYLTTLLQTCDAYSELQSQVKIILTPQLEAKLQNSELKAHAFLSTININGAEVAKIADKIAQAVPGALVNEAAFRVPTYFHEKTVKSYLPENFFTNNLTAFFATKQISPHTREELNLPDEPTATAVAKLMMR